MLFYSRRPCKLTNMQPMEPLLWPAFSGTIDLSVAICTLFQISVSGLQGSWSSGCPNVRRHFKSGVYPPH